MVVAEVPLWVIHKKNDGLMDTFASHSHSASAASEASRAAHAVELWQPSTKCPIYSLDCFGSLFATGGGDGAVRIWNTAALFRNSHPGSVNTEGGYVSEESMGNAASSFAVDANGDDTSTGGLV